MRKRGSTSTPRSSRSSGKGLASAATLLPLAIGLGSNLGTPQPTTAVHPAAVAIEPAESLLHPACTLPFSSIQQGHPIDESCGVEGAAHDQAQIAQNTAKNNFCAAGSPVSLTFAQFSTLQENARAAGVTFGSALHVPQNRSSLRGLLSLPGGENVGEGTVVRVAAYVIDAHYSNVTNGESVNCNTPGDPFNDIHIVLGENSPTEDPCQSVTAEISPHFRPDAWMPANLNTLAASRRFRFTGQLFFDASHSPCSGTSRSNPPRRSLFEIHPVYDVDVCKIPNPAPAQCDVNDNGAWVPLHQWLGTGATETG